MLFVLIFMFAFLRFAFFLIFALLILFVSSAWLGITFLVPPALMQAVYKETAFLAESSKLSLNPFKPSLSLDSLVLYNSQDFEDKAFIDIYSAGVTLDAAASRRERLVFEDVHLGVGTLTVVRNAHGDVNVKMFSDRVLALFDKASNEFQRMRDRSGSPQEGTPLEYLIRTCHVSLDKVVVIDYKDRKEPYFREFDLSFDLVVHDVSSLDAVVAPLAKELSSVTGAVVVDAVFYSLQRLSFGLFNTEILTQTGKIVGGAAQASGKVIKGTAEVGGKALQGAGKVVKGLLGGS